MVSGLFSAKTVVHLSTTPATASFEHAVAICTETPALNASTTALIARRVCIISSLISSATRQPGRIVGYRIGAAQSEVTALFDNLLAVGEGGRSALMFAA